MLLSVVSSQLEKIEGIYRVHLILTGNSGVGKSSTIKSIIGLFYDNADGFEDYIVLKLTRMTKESLGRLDVDTTLNSTATFNFSFPTMVLALFRKKFNGS